MPMTWAILPDTIVTFVEDSFPYIVEQIGGSVERRCVDMARAQAYCHGARYWSRHFHQHRNQPAFLQTPFKWKYNSWHTKYGQVVCGFFFTKTLMRDIYMKRKFCLMFLVVNVNCKELMAYSHRTLAGWDWDRELWLKLYSTEVFTLQLDLYLY